MIAVLAVIVLALFIGYPFAARWPVEPSLSGRIGLGFLLGTGIVSVVIYLLGTFAGGWTRPMVLAVLLAIGGSGWMMLRKREGVGNEKRLESPGPGALLLLFSAAMVAGHARFATFAPPIELDFLENWGLKAKRFWFAGGIDWRWLAHDAMWQNHADYPPLLPMLYDAAALVRAEWSDEGLGLFFTAFAVATLLMAEAALRGAFPRRTIAVPIAIVALTPLALTPWIGIGEGPLIAFLAGGAILLHRGVACGSVPAVTMGAVLLGFGALTKNEGATLVIAAAAGLAAAGSARSILRLWPAAVLALLWLVPRQLFGLSGDLAAGDPLGRLLAQLAAPGELVRSLVHYSVGRPLLWVALASAFLVAGRTILRVERLRLTMVAVQFLFYLTAYLVTPHDIEWHVRWSWERVVSHLTFLIAFAAIWGGLFWIEEERGSAAVESPAG